MVKHIVLFKLRDDVSASEKLAAMKQFKLAIEALPSKIPVIRKIEVGLNINPEEKWSIALNSDFNTLDDVKFYSKHPEHLKAGALLAGVKESRACVDYEYD
ncbi:MAG: Dabb family protein [Bacteroidaceae bacterium]